MKGSTRDCFLVCLLSRRPTCCLLSLLLSFFHSCSWHCIRSLICERVVKIACALAEVLSIEGQLERGRLAFSTLRAFLLQEHKNARTRVVGYNELETLRPLWPLLLLAEPSQDESNQTEPSQLEPVIAKPSRAEMSQNEPSRLDFRVGVVLLYLLVFALANQVPKSSLLLGVRACGSRVVGAPSQKYGSYRPNKSLSKCYCSTVVTNATPFLFSVC